MPDEEELEKLREQKKEELSERESQEEDRKEQIKQLASQYLTKEARSRLANIRAADPEKASAVEAQVARLGRAGQIDKLDDGQLKNILRSIQEEGDKTDIKFRR